MRGDYLDLTELQRRQVVGGGEKQRRLERMGKEGEFGISP